MLNFIIKLCVYRYIYKNVFRTNVILEFQLANKLIRDKNFYTLYMIKMEWKYIANNK